MAIKFEKIEPGMILYDRHREQAGNTTMRRLGEWTVQIISVDPVKRTAETRWNGNRVKTMTKRSLEKLYNWSMYDETEAEIERGLVGPRSVRRLPKAERDRRKAEKVEAIIRFVKGEGE